jgi:hypothetical protein
MPELEQAELLAHCPPFRCYRLGLAAPIVCLARSLSCSLRYSVQTKITVTLAWPAYCDCAGGWLCAVTVPVHFWSPGLLFLVVAIDFLNPGRDALVTVWAGFLGLVRPTMMR